MTRQLVFLVAIFTAPCTFGNDIELDSSMSTALTGRDGRQSKPAVHATFEVDAVDGGPFPSDLWTVPESRNRTGRKVNLPLPNCATRPSDCNDVGVVNALDGFNLQPRLSIPFDGEIDPYSVSSASVFLLELGQEDDVANTSGINQVVWDPATLSLQVESDKVLRQTTRYALIVTTGIRDAAGRAVEASESFQRFRSDLNYGHTRSDHLKDYRKTLLDTLAAAERIGISKHDVVVASVFTTQSATAPLEHIRNFLDASPAPAPADFALAPGGARSVFALSSISRITSKQHTGLAPDTFATATVPVTLLNQFAANSVGRVAFGRYLSPQFIDSNATMSPSTTVSEVPTQYGEQFVHFDLFLPSGTPPAAGWPVAILEHGGGNNIQESAVWSYPGSLASRGIAAIAINAVGRGWGPKSTLQVRLTSGATVEFLAGGRSIDQNGDGVIKHGEGAAAVAPNTIAGERDAVRQTIVDLMQLVRVIQVGMDVDGDGTADLDRSSIRYFGNSFSGAYGFVFMSVEPNVPFAAFGSPGGLAGRTDLGRTRPSARSAVGTELAAHVPSLLNEAYGLTSLGGIAVSAPYFNENIPLRDLPPVTNNIPGAMGIQQYFERIEWAQQGSDAAAYASHLSFEPLPGVPAKPVLILFGKGDMTAPNPRTSVFIRAGLLHNNVIFYRNDLAFAEDNTVPKDPHPFMSRFTATGIQNDIARGGQLAVGRFLTSGGTEIIHPEPARFFEVPIVTLPEDYSYIP